MGSEVEKLLRQQNASLERTISMLHQDISNMGEEIRKLTSALMGMQQSPKPTSGKQQTGVGKQKVQTRNSTVAASSTQAPSASLPAARVRATPTQTSQSVRPGGGKQASEFKENGWKEVKQKKEKPEKVPEVRRADTLDSTTWSVPQRIFAELASTVTGISFATPL